MANKTNPTIVSSWTLLPPPVGSSSINKTSPEKIFSNVFLTDTALGGSTSEFNFIDKSIPYFTGVINQTFQYAMIDNRGTGVIRVCYNKLGLDMSTAVNGSKTLGAGESFYIEEGVKSIGIYYVDDSDVELVLKSFGSTTNV